MTATSGESTAARSRELQALARSLAGQFEVIRELGRGGMGVVVLARDLRLDRLVAIKVLPAAVADDEWRERFLREARTAAQLSHPNIVPIYRADESDGLAFFVMGFVDGESLAERVQARGRLPAADVVPWLREVAWALAYAHARGVVHRDVKPENIMVERSSGRAFVTDFGIARDAKADGLTATGSVLGTVHYMSPEQASGEPLDGRSDLYALGLVGFYLLAGRQPFEGLAAHAVLVAHATRPAPPLSSVAPEVPRAVAAVIDRCLAKRPDERYATGEELAAALAKALEDASRDARVVAPGTDVVMSEAQAEQLWRRAAQLQAETLQRLDTQRANSALTASTAASGADGTSGFKLDHVRQAAVEAGISGQFFDLALAEVPRDRSGAPLRIAPETTRLERNATPFLGTAERSVSVSRVVAASPARVLQALGMVWRLPPYSLELRAPIGGHPLDGGVLVFDLPGSVSVLETVGINMSWYATRHALEAAQLQVTLKALPGTGESTEVTVFCDLRPGVRRNVLAASWMAGAFGGFGSVFGALAATVAAKTALVITMFTITVPAVLAGVSISGLTILGYRATYRAYVNRARKELAKALDAIEGGIQSEALFGALSPPRLEAPREDPLRRG
jgi:eukaryotic-like serine/threonine-protein kinase